MIKLNLAISAAPIKWRNKNISSHFENIGDEIYEVKQFATCSYVLFYNTNMIAEDFHSEGQAKTAAQEHKQTLLDRAITIVNKLVEYEHL